jgi:hypothetical protein
MNEIELQIQIIIILVSLFLYWYKYFNITLRWEHIFRIFENIFSFGYTYCAFFEKENQLFSWYLCFLGS